MDAVYLRAEEASYKLEPRESIENYESLMGFEKNFKGKNMPEKEHLD